MALIDLYKVTKTLIDLLRLNITQNIDPSLDDGVLQVTGIPPEKVESASNRLNFFLYHIAEDAYYKNALGPGSDAPNVAKTPMALNLFYILTAHHEVGEDAQFDAETQQKLMGYGLKTFHDFPVITDKTRIDDGTPDGTLVLDADLRGKDNSLEVILRPVSAEDAIAFWGSEETRTVRLSAYYEVRVILLEPEPPKTMPGIVLNLGTFLVQVGSPHLDRSQSLVRFQLPERNGGMVQSLPVSPARVTLDSSPEPPERPQAHNRLQLLGTNLTAGQSRSLVFKNSIWMNFQLPDSEQTIQVKQAIVDLDRNPDWQVTFASDRIEVVLTPTLTYVMPDETTVDLPMLPGFYSAFVRSVLEEKVINGELKQITATSNEIGFAIAPRLVPGYTIVTESIGDPPNEVAIDILEITLGGEFDLRNPNLPEDAIQVIVAGEVYAKSKSIDDAEEPVNPPANPREFFITETTDTAPNRIRLHPHFSVMVSESIAYPFRLVVNGAESAPFWIELNPPP